LRLIAFSGKAIIVKLAYRHGVDAVTLIMYRMLFALPIFAVMAWWASRGKPPLSRKDWLGVLGLGVTGYYLASFLDFAGLAYISASLERLILYLNPTLVMVLGWALYGRIIRCRRWAWPSATAAWCWCLAWRPGCKARTPPGVRCWCFLSAVSYAVYLVYSGEMVKRIGSLRLVGWPPRWPACAACCPVCAAAAPEGGGGGARGDVAVGAQRHAVHAAPVLMVMMAIERIGAGMAAQTGMVGPLSTILMGVWILGEPFTLWVAAGTAAGCPGGLPTGKPRGLPQPAHLPAGPGQMSGLIWLLPGRLVMGVPVPQSPVGLAARARALPRRKPALQRHSRGAGWPRRWQAGAGSRRLVRQG
jgi:drug/metabolite transporter (DMT)-like permease